MRTRMRIGNNVRDEDEDEEEQDLGVRGKEE